MFDDDEDHKQLYSPWQVISVPFSWELKPGVSKPTTTHQNDPPNKLFHYVSGLNPPPPGPKTCRPPHGPGAGISRTSSSRKGRQHNIGLQDDPFEIAYRKCTAGNQGREEIMKKKKLLVSLSCRYSCGVSEDNLVRIVRSVPKDVD